MSDRTGMVGRVVAGRFHILRLLGEGGMGQVFEAEQRDIGRHVALKLMRLSTAGDRDRERFLREARTTSRLQHPGLALIYDFGPWDEGLYLAMELIRGGALARELAERGRLPGPRAAQVLSQICEVLEVAHGNGVLHRDLKPENVMFARGPSGGEQVKVVDFGLALLLDPAEERLTREGMVSGTPAYMAPEQCRARTEDLDGRADIYALGVMLYEMLCGRLPFVDETPAKVLIQHLYQDPKPPSDHCPEAEIHPALEALALWALAKDPDRRPATAAIFRQELMAALSLVQQGPGVGPPGISTREKHLSEARDEGEVMVLEPDDVPVSRALTTLLRARGLSASMSSDMGALARIVASGNQGPVVIDLRPDPDGMLARVEELTAGSPEGRSCLVAVGPDEDMALIQRTLELGLGYFVPESTITASLPQVIKRIRKRLRKL